MIAIEAALNVYTSKYIFMWNAVKTDLCTWMPALITVNAQQSHRACP